jgi:DNA-directed RNA polymerase subunit RPC12/RpoP
MEMASRLLRVLIYIVSAILIILGLLFMIASYADISRFFVGLAFLVVAGVLIYLGRGEKKPIEIRQTVNLSGTPVVKEVKCPNCGAIVDPTKVEVITGKPYVTCSYCGNKFELTEEPKW